MPAPYHWDWVSITSGFDCLEYWRAPCSVEGCTRHAELDWKIDPRRVPGIKPLCPDHQA